jgi:FixJ family two-component response regulator
MQANIFVVDDDVAARDAMSQVINALGWTAKVCASARDCLAQVAKALPACIVCDLNLAGMNGAALIESLRVDGFAPPIIVVSAAAPDSQLAKRAKVAGVTAFVAKPVRDHDLKQALSDALGANWTRWNIR